MRRQVVLAALALVAGLGALRADEAADGFEKDLAKCLDRYADDATGDRAAKAIAICEARLKAKADDYAALLELARLRIAKEEFEGGCKLAEQATTVAGADKARLDVARIVHLLGILGGYDGMVEKAPEAEREALARTIQEKVSALEKVVIDAAGGQENAMKAVTDEQAKIEAVRALPELGKPLDKAIEKKDTAGKDIKLDDYKGKVLLVDFWATWCGPCVAEMPNVVKTYAELHDKGFEVIGVSLDQDREPLDEFIKENKIPWRQFFDGKGWENEVAQAFKITSIPRTYLVDHEGKVRWVGIRGEALKGAVEELLARAKKAGEKK